MRMGCTMFACLRTAPGDFTTVVGRQVHHFRAAPDPPLGALGPVAMMSQYLAARIVGEALVGKSVHSRGRVTPLS